MTRGPTENVNSLLYLRGIDAAIINSDSLDEYKNQVPDILRKIVYVLNLFPSELHESGNGPKRPTRHVR